MSNYYIAKNDIYDKNGILLIRKGQKVTNAQIAKLKKLESYKPDELVGTDDLRGFTLNPIAKAFGRRMKILDYRILEKSNNILSSIIFDSKTKPWWIYINALSNYIDWLYTHSIDVAMISLLMAEEIGYDDNELFYIGLGALLHDVGKLLIPKSIIQKPGPLTDTEMTYIRQHCELGMSSLEPFNLPKECTDIILHHHERLDGSGYPSGLKDEAIILNVRIVMIADAVDAITAGRPYKKSKEMDAAIKILRNEKEKYPQALITLLDKILNKGHTA